MKLITRWFITAIAVAVAVWLVPGIHVVDPPAWLAVALVAMVLALLNIYIKPLLKALSGCLLLFTLGLFSLVINAGLLYFSAWVCNSLFGIGFIIDGFWPAFWGGFVISIVTVILNGITGTSDSKVHR